MPSPSTSFSSTNPIAPRVVGIDYGIFSTPANPVNPTEFTAPAGYNLFVTKEASPAQNLGSSGDWALRANVDSIVLYQKTNIWNAFTTITGAASANLTAVYNDIASINGELSTLSASISMIQGTYATQGYVLARKTEAITASNGYADAKVLIESQARALANGYLEGKYTLTVQAGNVITGMNITSASGNGVNISEVIFRADKFQIWNGSSSQAVFSLDGSDVTISGWKINPSSLTGGNVTLNSAGIVTVGTGNDVAIMSADNATWRFWAGHAVSTSAPFRVDKDGNLVATSATISGTITSSSGTIGGFTLSPSSISAGTGNNRIVLFGGALGGNISIGSITTPVGSRNSNLNYEGLQIGYLSGVNTTSVLTNLSVTSGGTPRGKLELYDSAASWGIVIGGVATFGKIVWDSNVELYRDGANSLFTNAAFTCSSLFASGAVSASSFSGSGGSLTGINASNISSGTLSNSRLAFSVGNLASMNISGETPTGDVPIQGYVTINGIKLATVA